MFYVYFCPKCGKEIEVRHSVNETPKIVCPNDGTIMKKKITGGNGVIYKGIGWASKNNATSPKPRHYHQEGLALPKQFKDIVKK